jgi:hypothetical protein
MFLFDLATKLEILLKIAFEFNFERVSFKVTSSSV